VRKDVQEIDQDHEMAEILMLRLEKAVAAE
jgi:hypothetical protein